jgi:hypothetical protein
VTLLQPERCQSIPTHETTTGNAQVAVGSQHDPVSCRYEDRIQLHAETKNRQYPRDYELQLFDYQTLLLFLPSSTLLIRQTYFPTSGNAQVAVGSQHDPVSCRYEDRIQLHAETKNRQRDYELQLFDYQTLLLFLPSSTLLIRQTYFPTSLLPLRLQ